MTNDTTSAGTTSSNGGWSTRRWLVILFFTAIVAAALYTVVNPFPDQPYIEIPHGDHVHYVPKDRDERVPLSDFPTEEPGPNERIMPDGRVVRVAPDDGGQ
jgi:hypothetical protein